MSSVTISSPRPWWAATSALCANLVGIGVARFGYSALIPTVIAAGWFGPGEAAYLGGVNLAGYLVGALAGRKAAERIRPAWVLRAMMLLVAGSTMSSAGWAVASRLEPSSGYSLESARQWGR